MEQIRETNCSRTVRSNSLSHQVRLKHRLKEMHLVAEREFQSEQKLA